MTRRALAGVVIAIAIAAACIPSRPSPTSPPSAPSATPAPASPTDVLSPAAAVVVDPALLELLPDAVAGVPLEPDEATAAEIAREPSIAPFVSALAIAAAFRPQATGTDGDYVVVTVARVKPGLFGDLFYRGWRDTFDAAVCEQAGGVDGHAEAEIAGRQTFIGTCAGGVHTYHVHLPGRDVIVSMQAVGAGRFGERVVEGLTG